MKPDEVKRKYEQFLRRMMLIVAFPLVVCGLTLAALFFGIGSAVANFKDAWAQT